MMRNTKYGTAASHIHQDKAMPPSDYIRARAASGNKAVSIVEGRPYLPNIKVSPTDDKSVRIAAASIMSILQNRRNDCYVSPQDDEALANLAVKPIAGGITNSLFRVSGFKCFDFGRTNGISSRPSANGETANGVGGVDDEFDSVLVRVFGADGMIDRDVENSTYAALCDAGVEYRYLGRFANGRIEGWLDGYKALTKRDLPDPETSNGIAVEMARVHYAFAVPDYLKEHHNSSKPGMWTQLHSWMEQATGWEKFKTERDDVRAKALDLPKIGRELTHLEEEVVPKDARVAFCHNDLLAANIMMSEEGTELGPEGKKIQLIDFEYGGVNYMSFDIANHFNEFAGGTDEEDNGVPNYDLFPSHQRQVEFVTSYVRAAREIQGNFCGVEEAEEVNSLLKEIHAFVLADHLYWGLWAVNQAAMEGCDDFDYMQFAESRFRQYFKCKEEIESEIATAS